MGEPGRLRDEHRPRDPAGVTGAYGIARRNRPRAPSSRSTRPARLSGVGLRETLGVPRAPLLPDETGASDPLQAELPRLRVGARPACCPDLHLRALLRPPRGTVVRRDPVPRVRPGGPCSLDLHFGRCERRDRQSRHRREPDRPRLLPARRDPGREDARARDRPDRRFRVPDRLCDARCAACTWTAFYAPLFVSSISSWCSGPAYTSLP